MIVEKSIAKPLNFSLIVVRVILALLPFWCRFWPARLPGSNFWTRQRSYVINQDENNLVMQWIFVCVSVHMGVNDGTKKTIYGKKIYIWSKEDNLELNDGGLTNLTFYWLKTGERRMVALKGLTTIVVLRSYNSVVQCGGFILIFGQFSFFNDFFLFLVKVVDYFHLSLNNF